MSLTGAIAAALALSGAPVEASAQQIQPFMPGVRNDVRLGPSTQYATADGELRFVFDRSGGRVALLRFEGDPEVHVLRSIGGGAGGSELYRNDTNDLALRVTPQGGVTLYTRNHRAGAAVAETGAGAPITPQALAIAQYQARMRQLQAAAQRSLGRPVIFVAPANVMGPSAGLVIDAAERAAAGLIASPGVTVQRVIIRVGPSPGARINGRDLNIQVAPNLGYAGRPSTTAIRSVLIGPEQ
ncbi:MAG: DUF4908 domain-containing protein [Hyphomonadaceae bacterium]